MKIRNILIIAVSFMLMYSCGGEEASVEEVKVPATAGWSSANMSGCIADGTSNGAPADAAKCVCEKLEGFYPDYSKFEAIIESDTPTDEDADKVLSAFMLCASLGE